MAQGRPGSKLYLSLGCWLLLPQDGLCNRQKYPIRVEYKVTVQVFQINMKKHTMITESAIVDRWKSTVRDSLSYGMFLYVKKVKNNIELGILTTSEM